MSTLKQMILNITKLFAYEVHPPYININPSLLVPKYIQSDAGDTIIPGNSMNRDMSLRIIALELTVDYNPYPFVVIDSIYRYFDLKRTELKLKKYVKKSTPNEEYDESKHKPDYVILPESPNPLSGFKLWIDPNVYDENRGKIERGTQFISIFSPLENEIKTKEDLKNKISQFLWLLEICDENPTDFCFRFEIKIFLNNFKGSKISESFEVHSKYFNFEVTADGYSINLNYVSVKDFHIV